jgi:hypothetical protein
MTRRTLTSCHPTPAPSRRRRPALWR